MPNDKSDALSNVDVAVYALAILGGAEKTINTEQIAAKCFELAAARFSWVLPAYRCKWPDKEIVRTALEDGKKEANGALVQGKHARDTSKDGWRITPKGVEWIKKNKTRIAKALKQKVPTLPKREAERFTKRLRADTAFKHFKETGSLYGVSSYMFTDMLGCAPDASNDIIGEKFSRLFATVKLVNDVDLIRFLEACERTFSDLIEIH